MADTVQKKIAFENADAAVELIEYNNFPSM